MSFVPIILIVWMKRLKKSWEFWDCGQCVNNTLYNPAFEMSNTVSDTVVYYDLPSEILENVLKEI